MKNTTKSTHRQLVSFPLHLLNIAKYRAKYLGLSFSGYVKHLIINDNQNIINSEEEWLTEEQEKSLAKSMADVKAGRVNEITDIKKFVDSLGK